MNAVPRRPIYCVRALFLAPIVDAAADDAADAAAVDVAAAPGIRTSCAFSPNASRLPFSPESAFRTHCRCTDVGMIGPAETQQRLHWNLHSSAKWSRPRSPRTSSPKKRLKTAAKILRRHFQPEKSTPRASRPLPPTPSSKASARNRRRKKRNRREM